MKMKMNMKYVRFMSFLLSIWLFVGFILSIMWMFIIAFVGLFLLFLYKMKFMIKNKKFKEKRRLLIKMRLLRNHCCGIKRKWYEKRENGCIYYHNKECKRNSLLRNFCIDSCLTNIDLIKNNDYELESMRENVENEKRENC